MKPHEQKEGEDAAGTPESQKLHAFALKYRHATKSLFHGKLFDRIERSEARRQKDWRNVAKHCLDVARALDALADMLDLPAQDRESMIHVGILHDWNKRLQKDPGAFSAEERAEAEAHAACVLDEHDPDGHLLNATEPDGLARLETDEASPLEHYVHLIDLSVMPVGVVPTEKRIANLRERQAYLKLDERYPRFWDRKEVLTKREEADILGKLRAKGMHITEGTRLCDLLNERIKIH